MLKKGSLLERVVTTFVTVFVAFTPATLAFTRSDTKAWLLTAGGAALGAVIALGKNAVFKPNTTVVWVNVMERFAWSFIEGACAVAPAVINLSNLKGLTGLAIAMAVGGGNAMLSLAKNLTAAASQAPVTKMLNTELGGPAPAL